MQSILMKGILNLEHCQLYFVLYRLSMNDYDFFFLLSSPHLVSKGYIGLFCLFFFFFLDI